MRKRTLLLAVIMILLLLTQSLAFTAAAEEADDSASAVYFKTSDDGTSIVSFLIDNTAGTSACRGTGLIAYFDERGYFSEIKTYALSAGAGQMNFEYAELDEPPAGYRMKAFLWDPDTYAPLCAAADPQPATSSVRFDRTNYPLTVGNTGMTATNYTNQANTYESPQSGDYIYLTALMDSSQYPVDLLKWESSDPQTAMLSSTRGLHFGMGGTATGNDRDNNPGPNERRVQAGRVGIATVRVINAYADKATCVITCIDNYDQSTVLAIDLNTGSLALSPGRTAQLQAFITPWDARIKTVNWTSSNAAVASVAANGTVTAVAEGVAVITGTTMSSGRTATCLVTVAPAPAVPVAGVSLDKAAETMNVGETTQLSAAFTPAAPTNQKLIWSASAPSIVDVDENGNVTAYSRTVKPGTTQGSDYDQWYQEAAITVTTEDGGYRASCSFTVNDLPVETWAVNLSAYELSIPAGATYTYNEGSYNPGSYYSNSAGTAGAYTHRRLVSNTGPYEPHPFNPAAAGVHVVKMSSLVATLTPANATEKAVTWESSDTSVVTVTQGARTLYDAPTAVITGVAPGTAQIIAKSGGKQAVCNVTVTDGTVKASSISLNKPSAMTLYADATVTDLTATVLPDNATDKVVVFTSSNPDVAYIDKYDGVIWAHAPGTATITARARGGDSVIATIAVTVEAGNKYIRNLMTPPESVTSSSVLLLWNRDAYNNITDLDQCRIYKNGEFIGTSTRELSARDLTSGGLKTETVGQRQVTHWTSPLSHAVAREYAIRMGAQVKGLQPDTEYTLRVDACNASGAVLGSDTITIRTKPAPTAVIDVTKPPYNATGNGVNTDTYAIQRAVNDCPAGGTVLLPEGHVFFSGAIFLKSDMTFTVDGILIGSTNPKDYPRMNTRWEGWRKIGTGTNEDSATIPNSQSHSSIVTIGAYDEGVNTKTGPFHIRNVVVNGKGQINANGFTLGYHQGPNSKAPKVRTSYVLYNKARSGDGLDFRVRSRMLTVQSSQNIYVSNVTVSYSASWGIHNIFADRVTYDSIDVILRGYGRSGTADQNCILNGDGINPDSTSNLNIFDCYFNAGDDCITLKSGRNGQGWLINKPTKFIRATDSCTVGSKGGWAIGSEQAGGANNTLLQNFYAEDINLETIWVKYRWARGGLMEYLDFRDTSMNWIRGTAVWINPGYSSGSHQPATEAPICRKLFFENITSESVTGRTCTGWSFAGVNAGSESVLLSTGVNQTLFYPILGIQDVVIKNSGLATGNNNNTTSFSMAYVSRLTATNLNYFTTPQPTTYAATNTNIVINGRQYNMTP